MLTRVFNFTGLYTLYILLYTQIMRYGYFIVDGPVASIYVSIFAKHKHVLIIMYRLL